MLRWFGLGQLEGRAGRGFVDVDIAGVGGAHGGGSVDLIGGTV